MAAIEEKPQQEQPPREDGMEGTAGDLAIQKVHELSDQQLLKEAGPRENPRDGAGGQPPVVPRPAQPRYIRHVLHSPVYTPSFNNNDVPFFAGLLLVTVFAFATRLHMLSQPEHVA